MTEPGNVVGTRVLPSHAKDPLDADRGQSGQMTRWRGDMSQVMDRTFSRSDQDILSDLLRKVTTINPPGMPNDDARESGGILIRHLVEQDDVVPLAGRAHLGFPAKQTNP